MAAKVPDIYQENIYAEPLLNMPERYKALQRFLDIDGEWEPNWKNMTQKKREERIREIILEEFPKEREAVERCIRELWEMADAIDETHRKCTLANLAASSTSASSGILSILGMSLAPFTAGGSLILTTAGLGLGAVATAASLSANWYESASTSKETEKAQMLMDLYREQFRLANCPNETNFYSEFPTSNTPLEKNNQNLVATIASSADTALGMYKTAKKINANIKALKFANAQANTGLKGLAGRATEAGRAIWDKIRGVKQAKTSFAGTSIAMSKGARLLGAAMSGAFVLLDAYSVAQNAKHLQEGVEAETAAEIRKTAKEMEEELEELIKLYEEVRRDHYLQQRQITRSRRSSAVPFRDGHSHLLPTRPQQPTQINGVATTKLTRANSVGQNPMRQQTLMDSPQGYPSVGGSGSLQPACQKQGFTASASTFSQRSWNWKDKQVQGIDFQGDPHLRDEREGDNTRALELSEVTSGRVKKEQEETRRLLEIKHLLMADETQENQIEEVVFQRVTHTPTDRGREGNIESRVLSGNTLSRGRKEQGRTWRPLDIEQSLTVEEKLRLARSVGHHPTQQTLMGSPLDFQSVVGSGSPQPASQQQRPIATTSIISRQSSKWQDNQVEGAVFQSPLDGKKDSSTRVKELSERTSVRTRRKQRRTRRPLDRKHSPVAQDYQVNRTVYQEGNHTLGSRVGNIRAEELSESTSYMIRKRQGGTRRPLDIKNSLVADDSEDD